MDYNVKIMDKIDMEVLDLLATKITLTEGLLGKSKEILYAVAIDDIKNKIGKIYTDPLGQKVFFAPGNTETVESYALHLIAGQNKLISDIRLQRVIGLLLANLTIEKPWAIIVQDNGGKMYLAVYKSRNSMTNSLIVGVEEGQSGRVITSTLAASQKGDKKAALRELKKRISGAKKILYIWEGLTGHSRPSSDQRASLVNANLNSSGE